MSVPMVGPGPLAGGPKKSPGPAKSGDTFSAHFEKAYDHSPAESASAASKPSADQHKKTDAPSKKSGSKKSDIKEEKATPPSGSPRLAKGKAAVAPKGEAPLAQDAAEPTNVDAVVNENPEGAPGIILIPDPLQVTLAVEMGSMKPTQEGEIDPTLLEGIIQIGLIEPTEISAKPPPEPSQNSDTEPQEEPAKNEVKPLDVPAPVLAPVLINLAIVQPTEPKMLIENETHAIPANEDPFAVPGVSAVVNTPAPALEGPMPLAGPEIQGTPTLKAPDVKNVELPEERPERTQKNEKVSLVTAEDAKDKTVSDRPTLDFLKEPADKAARPEPPNPSTENQGKELRKDVPEPKEGPRPAPILHPETMASVSLTTDVVAKIKETPGILPVGSAPAGRGGGETVPVGSVSLPAAPPVSEVRPAEAVRRAPPVVAPSPVDIAQQIHVHLESGRSVVRIDLHPEHMGELRISMETKGKDVSMQFTVDNDNARHAVVAGLREITGTLSSLGWSVNGLAVNVSSGGVGNGRGESNGPLWGAGQNLSNTLPAVSEVSAPKQGAGEWRVDLVA